MSPAVFIVRGMRHHGRLHAAAAAGVAVATAVLTGALMLGDSVRFSLERRQLLRLGRIEAGLAVEDRFFRAALAGLLPEKVVYRGKQGYSLPVKHLLRGELKDYMVTLLKDSPVIRENMNESAVDTLIDEHLTMKHNHNHILWALINVAIWHHRFFS